MLMQTTLWVPFIKQMKQLAQIQQQQQAGSSQQQQQQSAAPQQQQQDRLAGVPVDISTSFRSSDPVYGGVEPSSGTNSTGTGKDPLLDRCVLFYCLELLTTQMC
jgi:hypothetical protein